MEIFLLASKSLNLHQVPMLRMRGAVPPLPQYVFMAWCLIKRRDKFTLPWRTKIKFDR
jgi:hypothetical protein